jgi:hypothetical protein
MEFFTTYQRAATVAWVCLNLPRHLFEQLVVPEEFAEWKPFWAAYRANANRGFLFACLIENGRGLDTSDMDRWLDEALKRSGLPPLTDLRDRIDEERQKVAGEAIDGPYRERLQDLLNAGTEYAKAERGEKNFRYTFLEGPMPPLLLQDNKFLRPRPLLSGQTFANPGDWVEEAFRLENRLRQFVDACIV